MNANQESQYLPSFLTSSPHYYFRRGLFWMDALELLWHNRQVAVNQFSQELFQNSAVCLHFQFRIQKLFYIFCSKFRNFFTFFVQNSAVYLHFQFKIQLFVYILYINSAVCLHFVTDFSCLFISGWALGSQMSADLAANGILASIAVNFFVLLSVW